MDKTKVEQIVQSPLCNLIDKENAPTGVQNNFHSLRPRLFTTNNCDFFQFLHNELMENLPAAPLQTETNQNPQPEQLDLPKSSLSKSTVLLLLAVVVVITLVLGGGVGYFIGLSQPKNQLSTQPLSSSQPPLAPNAQPSPLAQFSSPTAQVLPSPQPTASTSATDTTMTWKMYIDNRVSFSYPSNWVQSQPELLGTGSVIEFKDPNNIYTLSFSISGNYNNQTGKPFSTLDEYVGLAYQTSVLTVGGQDARQPLPRAGSETDDEVVFFSKDKKSIYSIELDGDRNHSDQLQDEQVIFNHIVQSFTFVK